MIIKALVEQWPEDVAIYIHELPGVIVAGATLDDALGMLSEGVDAHVRWLAAHGFDVARFAGVEIDVAEQMPATQAGEGPLFDADREPATPEIVDNALQVAALARRDLVDLYRSVAPTRRDAPPAGGDWSIADHLRHIAESEAWYIDSMRPAPYGGLPHDPLEAMHASAGYASDTLRSLDDTTNRKVFERSSQRWTANKVMRRMVGHLREHNPWVQEIARH